MQVVEALVNRCYGGFGASNKAKDLYIERTGKPLKMIHEGLRTDPILIQIVKELGIEAKGQYSIIVVCQAVENYWDIYEYDGLEQLYFTDNVSLDVEQIVLDKTKTPEEKIKILCDAYEEKNKARELSTRLWELNQQEFNKNRRIRNAGILDP